jgi:hypothetical protein
VILMPAKVLNTSGVILGVGRTPASDAWYGVPATCLAVYVAGTNSKEAVALVPTVSLMEEGAATKGWLPVLMRRRDDGTWASVAVGSAQDGVPELTAAVRSKPAVVLYGCRAPGVRPAERTVGDVLGVLRQLAAAPVPASLVLASQPVTWTAGQLPVLPAPPSVSDKEVLQALAGSKAEPLAVAVSVLQRCTRAVAAAAAEPAAGHVAAAAGTAARGGTGAAAAARAAARPSAASPPGSARAARPRSTPPTTGRGVRGRGSATRGSGRGAAREAAAVNLLSDEDPDEGEASDEGGEPDPAPRARKYAAGVVGGFGLSESLDNGTLQKLADNLKAPPTAVPVSSVDGVCLRRRSCSGRPVKCQMLP